MPGKILIFGRSGQLGSELVRVFTARGDVVQGYSRAEADVTNPEGVRTIIHEQRPDYVLNATAYNMVDLAEREPQVALTGNALAVQYMAVACASASARLVHFSTDYVFDGTAGRPYREEDSTHPLGAYAVSKLTGEMYAQAYLKDALVIRTSGVFGLAGLGTARGNFVETMLRLGRGEGPVRIVEDFCASPTCARCLAERTSELLDQGAKGLFHVGGGEAIAWLNFARMIFEEAGLRPDVRAVSEEEFRTAARRPRYSALDNSKMESFGVTSMPPLRSCLREYLSSRSSAV